MCMNHAGFACSMPCSLVMACWNAYMHANVGLNDEIMKTFLLIFFITFRTDQPPANPRSCVNVGLLMRYGGGVRVP